MINRLASLVQRPERGWDPVPSTWARTYADAEWDLNTAAIINRLEEWVSGFEGKRLLDLGGGPGQYSVALAKRGAQVTWHDISHNYLQIARSHAEQAGVKITFSMGYLEEAARLRAEPFDIVFSRCCWNYCRNDRDFAQVIYHLVKPGGSAYIDSPISTAEQIAGYRRVVYLLNRTVWLKVGHPFPPRARIARLFCIKPMERLVADYSHPQRDVLLFTKNHLGV